MSSAYAKKLAATAVEQYDSFHEFSENDPPLAAQIKRYFQGIGVGFPGVKAPWAAAFVSWCVKTAGASSNEFVFAPTSARFVNAAIKNALQGTGVFRALEVDKYQPQVGDIIQNNRGNKFSYDYARTHKDYPSHSAIVVEVGADHQGHYAYTIGGNESDSIRRQRVALNKSGFINQRPTNPYICVIQDLK